MQEREMFHDQPAGYQTPGGIPEDTYAGQSIHASHENEYRLDYTDVKEIIGDAISQVEGVLGLKGNFSDMFKADEDLTRGIQVEVKDDKYIMVWARIISETGWDRAEIIDSVTAEITDTLQNQAGLHPEGMCIEIADVMTRSEFYDKYNECRALN